MLPQPLPHNLPLQLSTFVGRERELIEVRRRLGQARLLTLTGMGGTGKTRVALQVAQSIYDFQFTIYNLTPATASPNRQSPIENCKFDDGVWWVELAPLTEPGLVISAVAAMLGIREQGSRPLLDTLVDHLRAKSLLLILDNCEHLINACAQLAHTLLRACPHIRILATSQVALGVPGELVWTITPLAVPDWSDDSGPAPQDLGRYEAVRLFIERATALAPGFTLTDQNAGAIAQVCRRLDGIPLAIELAAARVKTLTPQQMTQRLNDRFQLLTRGQRVAMPRHQTLRAAMDWSYELLTEDERVLLRRLSVFASSFSLAAAEEVTGDSLQVTEQVEGFIHLSPVSYRLSPDDILDLLSGLVDRSLVVVVESEESGETRYRLLETIRQYASERLTASGEENAIRGRCVIWCLRLVEQAKRELAGRDQRHWLRRLDAEYDTLRAALEWSLSYTDERGASNEVATSSALIAPHSSLPLRLASALAPYWDIRGQISEGRRWLEAALTQAGAAVTQPKADTLTEAALLAFRQTDFAQAITWANAARAMYETLDDQRGVSVILRGLGALLIQQGNLVAAAEHLEASLARARAIDYHEGIIAGLLNLSTIAFLKHDAARVHRLVGEALALARTEGNERRIGMGLTFEGLVYLMEGQLAQAETWLIEALQVQARLGERAFSIHALVGIAGLAAHRRAGDRAARLLGAVEALQEGTNARLLHFLLTAYETAVADTKALLAPAAYQAAVADGQRMSWQEAVAFALATPPQIASPVPVPSPSVSILPAVTPPSPGPHAPAHPLPLARPRVAVAEAEVCLYALGTPRVTVGDRVLTSSDWTYTRARDLLFYLACHPPRTREQIGLAFWPDASPSQLRNNLATHLKHLRRAVGRNEWIVFDNGLYTFNRDLPYWYDVEDFEQQIADSRRLMTQNSPADAIRHLPSALSLYQGDFLEDMAADWAVERREALLRLYLETALDLAQQYTASGQDGAALQVYQAAIRRDPYLEAAHRGMMRALARQGEPAAALQHFRQMANLFQAELGLEPEAETRTLVAALRRGEKV